MSVSSASLAGKVAFVQGGSRGIGAAIVRRLAAEGASVAFTYVSSADKSRALAAELEGAGASILALHAHSADAAARTPARPFDRFCGNFYRRPRQSARRTPAPPFHCRDALCAAATVFHFPNGANQQEWSCTA